MKINTFLMFLIQPIQSQSVETLLKSAISSAKCHAKCLSSSTPEDQLDCLSICSQGQSNPRNSVCQGLAKTVSVHEDTKLSSLVQQSCQLVWKMNQKENENFVFVVAGKDVGGMWSLMFNRITERRVELTELMTAKFEEITVLAVDSQEVVDKATVKIEHAKCENNVEDFEEITVKEISNPISCSLVCFNGQSLYFFSLITLIVLIIAFLCIISIMNRSDQDQILQTVITTHV